MSDGASSRRTEQEPPPVLRMRGLPWTCVGWNGDYRLVEGPRNGHPAWRREPTRVFFGLLPVRGANITKHDGRWHLVRDGDWWCDGVLWHCGETDRDTPEGLWSYGARLERPPTLDGRRAPARFGAPMRMAFAIAFALLVYALDRAGVSWGWIALAALAAASAQLLAESFAF